MDGTQPTRSARPPRAVRVRIGVGVLACAALLGLACAPRQRVPLEIVPGPSDAIELWVDGERLAVPPAELVLRADRDHKVFVRRPGYRPQLIVVRAPRGGSGAGLRPDRIVVHLVPAEAQARQLRIELEDPPPAQPSPPPAR